MGKNDIILCFNQSECIYAKCTAYNDTLSACELEWLKRVPVQAAAKPSQAQAPAAQQVVPQFRNPPMPQPAQPPAQGGGAKPVTPCKDVVEGMKNFKVHGKLLRDPFSREVTARGKPTTIQDITIDDGTANLRITFWNLSKVPALRADDEVTIEGLFGKAPYDGTTQANGGPYVKVTLKKV